MELQAWPFFISSHKVLGFTVVVAPDFMCIDQSARLLASYAGGEPGDVKHCEIPKIKDTTKDILTLTYRVVRAEGSSVGESAPVLRDAGGRAIPLIEGIVTKGKDKNIALTENDFQAVREAYQQAFKDLWQSSVIIPTQPSSPITLSTPNFFLEESSEKTTHTGCGQSLTEENILIIFVVVLIIIVITFLIVLHR